MSNIPASIARLVRETEECEKRLRLHEQFWSADIVPTADIIKEHDELLSRLERILQLYPKMAPKKDPQRLEAYIAEVKERRAKYVKEREEEVAELVQERLKKLNKEGGMQWELRGVQRLDDNATAHYSISKFFRFGILEMQIRNLVIDIKEWWRRRNR